MTSPPNSRRRRSPRPRRRCRRLYPAGPIFATLRWSPSTARLTYEEIQARRDGDAERATQLTQEVLAALYGAFAALAAARARRGALELDIGENRVVLDAEGRPAAIIPVARLDSHRLIEE